jgi:hypothetical protein
MAIRQVGQIKARMLCRVFGLTADFTAAQVMRLVALRHRVRVRPDATDTIDARRLAFARWLVEHGHLSEELHQIQAGVGEAPQRETRGDQLLDVL